MTKHLAIALLLCFGMTVNADVTLIQSSDFQGGFDASIWTFVNPLNDASLITTSDMLQLVVPGGVSHDPFIDGTDDAARLMQPVSDQDFDVEVKFTTSPQVQDQMEGVLVEQDTQNSVRVQLYYDGASPRLAVVSVEDGAETVQSDTALPFAGPPFWMRLQRAGSTWTTSWSNNDFVFAPGTVFSASLIMTDIGVFAGNTSPTAGNAPGFAAGVAYFHSLASSATPLPLSVSNVVSAPQLSSAVVAWTTNEAGTSLVEYGLDTSYGNSVASDNPLTEHALTLTGLTCGAGYHFRVTSTNPVAGSATSGDLTFTTLPCASSGIESDDFTGATLNTARWSFISPDPGGMAAMSGTDVLITVPQGSTHDFLPSGDGAARLVQAVPDADFDVEVKFDSVVTSGYQAQGILIEQDPANFVRFEVHHDGTAPQLYAASFTGGAADAGYSSPFVRNAAPLWLRVQRNGSSWSFLWSIDGATWQSAAQITCSMVVHSMGPYAANDAGSGLPPAFTAAVDYFVERSNPLGSPDGGAVGFERVVIDANPPAAVCEKALADIDGDGRLDAIIGFSNPSPVGIYWYEFPHSGNPNDTWNKHTILPAGVAYEDMEAGDVNGDGVVDIVASMNGPVYWFENPRGSGGDRAQDPWRMHLITGGNSGGRSLALADLDGDGKLDVLTDSYIAFQNGADSWTTIDYGAAVPGIYTFASNGVALLDIGSGHGAVNVVTVGSSPYGIVWFENPIEHGGDPRRDVWTPHFIGPAFGPTADTLGVFAAADLNGDGKVDVISAGKSLGDNIGFLPGLTWWEAPLDPRTGTWTRHVIDDTFSQVQRIAVGDMDGDGNVDIVSAEQDQSVTHRLAVFYSDGQGHFNQQVLSYGGGHIVVIGDIQGSGRLDILNSAHGYYGAPHPIEIWLNRGRWTGPPQ
jgi:regulation of enolase protein 1 (concanavalin A-like superfamily)